MGDAAGEPPDRLHLLRLPQLSFDARDIGDVVERHREPVVGERERLDREDAGRDPVVGVLESRRRRAPRPSRRPRSSRVDERRRDAGKISSSGRPDDVVDRRARSRPRSPGSRSGDAASPVLDAEDVERGLHVLDDLVAAAAAARGERLARCSSFVLRITAPMNSAIRRAVSTASSSNACGSRPRMERTPTTLPSRWSGAQISDRMPRRAQTSPSARGSVDVSEAYTASPFIAARPARLAERSRRRPTWPAAIPEQWWYTDSCPSNHCTAAPSPPQRRCARRTIVLVSARGRARARRSAAASGRSHAAGRGSSAGDPRCACAA